MGGVALFKKIGTLSTFNFFNEVQHPQGNARRLTLRALLVSPIFLLGACALPHTDTYKASPMENNSSRMPTERSSNTPLKIEYALNSEVVYEVNMALEEQAFAIVLSSKVTNANTNANSNAHSNLSLRTNLKTQTNRTLLPRFEPIGGMQGRLLQLKPEVSGFSIDIEYPHIQGADRYLITFEHEGETPTLKRYRKEKLDLNGQVTSGIVADFDQMKARWLGHGIPTDANATSFQGPRSALPSLPLKKKPLLKFGDAISIFDYNVELDVPVRR